MSFIPNSFQLPNALVDTGTMAEMKGAPLAIYITIVRKTRGWQKEADAISISQFIKVTGYGKDAVIAGAEKLVSLGLVQRVSRDHRPASYSLTDLAQREINNLSEKPTSTNLSENQIALVGKSDYNLSENPTHKNNIKTTSKKQRNVVDKSYSKTCLPHSQDSLSLSEKQASFFASKLTEHPEFCSMHAEVGESGQKFVSRMKLSLRRPDFVKANLSYLEDVGFKRGAA